MANEQLKTNFKVLLEEAEGYSEEPGKIEAQMQGLGIPQEKIDALSDEEKVRWMRISMVLCITEGLKDVLVGLQDILERESPLRERE